MQKNTVILLDIGNTAATYGIAKNGRLTDFASALFKDVPTLIQRLSPRGESCLDVVVSSVVPENTKRLIQTFKKKSVIRFWIAGKNLPVPILAHYKKSQLGIDRLINALGCTRFYKLPCLVIDFGSAITFDYVSKQGTLEGGMIVPGPELAFHALIQKAALLPKKEPLPKTRKTFLGHSTSDCLKSGILEGYGSLTDELIRRFKARYGKNLQVIATGGFSKHIKPFARNIQILDPKLSVKSLFHLYRSQVTSTLPVEHVV